MSKQVHVTMSQEDYAALQADIARKEAVRALVARDKANRQKPELFGTAKQQHAKHHKHQQPAKPQPQGGIGGFTFLIVTAVLTVLALAGLKALGFLS